jgi:L-asparaginase
VDIITHHSDGDAVLLDAALAAGARGIVLAGTGAGNATPPIVDSVRRAVADGVLVVVGTRVAAGSVAPLYTGGGAVDLVAAGAELAGTLRPAQARIAVLAALLSAAGPDGAAAGPAAVLHDVLLAEPQALPVSELYLADGVGH